MKKLSEIFHVGYGNKLDQNKMSPGTISFIGRSEYNNGITAKVAKVPGKVPYRKGLITVALGGSVLSSFLQSNEFYTGQNVAVLSAKSSLSDSEKIFYCALIKANAFRFTACGREANRFLSDLMLPSKEEIPIWVNDATVTLDEDIKNPAINEATPILETANWKPFKYKDVFEVTKGKRLTKADMNTGLTPYIGSTESNNGLTAMIGQLPTHDADTISVSYNGSVAEAFYQPVAFWATDDVNVICLKTKNSPAISLFLCALIRKEKYRYNYGRKWTLEKMKQSTIKLPITLDGSPDWDFMEKYIKSLPYSSQLQNQVKAG